MCPQGEHTKLTMPSSRAQRTQQEATGSTQTNTGGAKATLFGFYSHREEGADWKETMEQSAYKDHLLRKTAPVWALGKERNLETALLQAITDGVPIVGPDAPALRKMQGGGGKDINPNYGWTGSGGVKERAALQHNLGVREFKVECNPGDLPKFLAHIAELNSVGRAKHENLNHLQGQVAMQAALMSMKKTSNEHPGFQVIEDRGLVNATADPLGWNHGEKKTLIVKP